MEDSWFECYDCESVTAVCRCYACDEFVNSSVSNKLHECVGLVRAALALDNSGEY